MTVPLIVGTGLVALDVVFRGTAQEPVRRTVGGTCGNVLSILRYLGWKAVPLARLGDDRARALVVEDLKVWGVDTSFLSLEPERPTPIVVERLVRDAAGNAVHRFSWTCPCCGAWLPKYAPVNVGSVAEIAEELPAPTVFFFDRPSRGALKLAEAYRDTNTLIVFEPSAKGDADAFAPALALADVVKYSDQRFATLPKHQPKNGRLEIQTLGAQGLRFRVSEARKVGVWQKQPALRSSVVVDSAGAGDWSTAGLLKRIAVGGREGFATLTNDEIAAALRYGQALASWNCQFEGARGGMYEQSKRVFQREVDALLSGAHPGTAVESDAPPSGSLGELCPSCPGGAKTAKPKGATHGATVHH